MAQRNDSPSHFPSEPRVRVDHRPSPRFALQISLGLHAFFALAMFRLYTEYAREPEPTLHIVARASATQPAATPSFVTTHVATAEATVDSIRPSANIEPLPHRSLSAVDATIAPLRLKQTGGRRATLPATLPAVNPVVTEVIGELPPADSTPAAASALSSRAMLQRAEALPDMPLRVAMRPVDGRREQRPLGLALLPATSSERPLRQPADAFTHRLIPDRTPRENRAAIDRGLEFLARIQQVDGRWRFDDLPEPTSAFPRPTSLRSDAAATGLALLTFFGAGHDHFDGRYQAVIQDGVDFLLRIQLRSGEFFIEDGTPAGRISSFYSHGIATLALCEAYGMTGDGRIKLPAQRALDSLAERLTSESLAPQDWAVFGWQLATLRSGRLAGLNVEPETLVDIGRNLSALQSRNMSPNATATAVGLAVELHLDRTAGSERLRPAANELLSHPPVVGPPPSDTRHRAAENPRRDSYYWYYGSQAMYYLGGKDWHSWSEKLYPRLIESQLAEGPWAGSWEPPITTRDEKLEVATRLYVTAMNLLSLETEQRQPNRN